MTGLVLHMSYIIGHESMLNLDQHRLAHESVDFHRMLLNDSISEM